MAIALGAMVTTAPAPAFEGGGRKPSEAPLITVGQHYTGQLNNHKTDANFNASKEVAFWRLPPLTTRDVITVDWHSVPFTNGNSGFPVCVIFAQGIDDYSWGGIFGGISYRSCYEEGPVYSLSGSGSAQTAITAQETNEGSSYLEFFSTAAAESPSSLETFPYDFTVEPVRHYLDVALRPVQHIRANSPLYATASLANGSPAPDGLAFTLTATWAGEESASYAASSSAGAIGFPLALPETAQGKKVTFVVSHAADALYQAAISARLIVPVAKSQPVPAQTAPCTLARRHLRAVGRQYTRLKRHADQARGLARRRLRHRQRRIRHELGAARAQVATACASS